MSKQLVQIRVDDRGEAGQVAYLSIDNTRRMNSLSSAVMDAFISAVAELSQNDSLRVLVVTGEGDRAFIGGADIFELNELDRTTARTFITRVHGMSKVLRDLPVPVIARVNGICLGAGVEVMAACDMRVAAEDAVFGMPEVKIGLPSVVEAALFPQLIGWGRTKQLVYTGENIGAAEALDWGLVEKVVPAHELDEAVEAWVAAIVESGPRAIRLQKELVRHWEALPVNDAIQEGIRNFARAFETDEPKRMTGEVVERLRRRRTERKS